MSVERENRGKRYGHVGIRPTIEQADENNARHYRVVPLKGDTVMIFLSDIEVKEKTAGAMGATNQLETIVDGVYVGWGLLDYISGSSVKVDGHQAEKITQKLDAIGYKRKPEKVNERRNLI